VPAACRPSAPLTVNIDQIPLLKDAIGPGIHIQPPRLDPEKRQVVRIATMAPGCLVPIHYHTGTAEVYTFSGCWKYAEYPHEFVMLNSNKRSVGTCNESRVTVQSRLRPYIWLYLRIYVK
jgi:hypothetical protein